VNPGESPDTGEPFVASPKIDWFSNVEFRRAVAYSIDNFAIVDEVFHGLGYPQWSQVSPSAGDFHNPDVMVYHYSPANAGELLEGLGWSDRDGDGIREDVRASQELDEDRRAEYYHRAQAIASDNVPLIYTALSERLTASRNVFGNLAPTLYALWDFRYLYRTDL